MIIGGLQKLTLIDYPGKLACTVFCVGCSFRCPFCYNSDLVLPEKIKEQLHPVKPSKAGISPSAKLFNGAKISEKEFFEFLKKRKDFLEGVVLSGGEPSIYKDLPGFCKKIKESGYSIKLDTNGFNPEMLKDLIGQSLIDYVALDVKAPKEKYLKAIGLPRQIVNIWRGFEGQTARGGMYLDFWGERIVKNIEKSINLLKQGKIDYEFRTTVVPKLLTKSDILEIAQWVSPARRYFLQNFRPKKTVDPDFEKLKPCSSKYLIDIQKAISPLFETCQIRG